MPRLQKSIEKKKALLKATLTLLINGGWHGASMAKVAAIAGVSPATIYLYFNNKQDLINKLYLEINENFSSHAFNGLDESNAVKHSFEKIWMNIADFRMLFEKEAQFLSQCDNSPIVDDEVRTEGLKHMQPLLNLWQRGVNEGIIKDVSPYLMYAYTIYPLSYLINKHTKKHCSMDENKMKNSFILAWDSIKV